MDKMIDEYLAFAHYLADISAEAIMPSFRNLHSCEHKSGQWDYDPVTEADRAGEKVIREALTEKYPHHGIIGEEFGNWQETAEYCWIIDPIDGTRAFITGVPLWGTLIGLYKNGKPLLGIMNQPFTKERYWNSLAGSFLRIGHEKQPQSLQTRKGIALEDAILSTTGPQFFASDEDRKHFETVSQKVRMTRYGYDCYAYCMLAAGHMDVVIESGLSAYDVGALIPLVEQAGGVMTNWEGGAAGEGGQILACGDPALAPVIMELLAAPPAAQHL